MSNRRNNRETRGDRLRWIVLVIVLAAATLCGLSSWEDKHGAGLLPKLELPSAGFVQDFIDGLEIRDDGGQPVAQMEKNLPDAGLEVHIQDMGQADSILVVGPERNLLIDAGENDQGEQVLRYLKQRGIKRLDYVIGSHPHSDHIGGLDTVIAEMEVGAVILPVIPEEVAPTTRTYLDLLEAVEDKGLKVTPAIPGKKFDLGDGALLTLLAPIGEYTDLNNFSVVSRLVYGDTSFLFTADASAGSEGDILHSKEHVKADVLDVGHHGSNTSTTEEFLDAVSPRIAVISCGTDNSYGHPHREVIERLEARGIQIWRTDRNGAIVIASNGERLSVSGEK